MHPLLIAGCSGILLILLLPSLAQANIGPKWWGDRTAEPQGLKAVAITQKKLTIDLRPLAAVQPVEVEAIYHLNNSGSTKKLDLLFITGVTGVSDFEVRLGDRRIESTELKLKELPASWEPPRQMPGIEWELCPVFTEYSRTVLSFVVELPPGPSILRARYRARASGTDESYPTVTWQFPYILAPAREWESFGGLDVTVHVPETWQANSTPTLEREGGILHGHFTTLPADCLALAVRAPVGPELEQAIWRYAALFGFTVLCGGVVCWWAGRVFGWFLVRRTSFRSSLWGLPFAFLMPVIWAASILEVWFLAREGVVGILASQESPYFHEHVFLPNLGTLCLMPFVLLGGFILTWRGFRRTRVTA